MTDADAIVRRGSRLSADYVLSGSITSVGSRKLLTPLSSSVDVIRQVAGVYLTCDSLDELNENEKF